MLGTVAMYQVREPADIDPFRRQSYGVDILATNFRPLSLNCRRPSSRPFLEDGPKRAKSHTETVSSLLPVFL
jgi:hypothetical protein